MAAGIYRPVDDALRIAFTELVGWIHADYGLSELDAYELLSQVGKIHLTEMVDPNYVVVASVEKKYLPPRSKPLFGEGVLACSFRTLRTLCLGVEFSCSSRIAVLALPLGYFQGCSAKPFSITFVIRAMRENCPAPRQR